MRSIRVGFPGSFVSRHEVKGACGGMRFFAVESLERGGETRFIETKDNAPQRERDRERQSTQQFDT